MTSINHEVFGSRLYTRDQILTPDRSMHF